MGMQTHLNIIFNSDNFIKLILDLNSLQIHKYLTKFTTTVLVQQSECIIHLVK